MYTNKVQNSNNTTFNAKLKIKKLKTFKEPDEYFENWLKEISKDWAQRAEFIGWPNDTITITLGKNDIGKGITKKQNLSASAKFNGLKITDNYLNFNYMKFKDNSLSRYYDTLNDKVMDFIQLISRLSQCKINK